MRTRTYRSRGLPDWPLRVLEGAAIIAALVVPLLLGWWLSLRDPLGWWLGR